MVVHFESDTMSLLIKSSEKKTNYSATKIIKWMHTNDFNQPIDQKYITKYFKVQTNINEKLSLFNWVFII